MTTATAELAGKPTEPPELDIDPFSDETLQDPYPFFASLRDAAPVVRLKRYGIYAVGRYEQVTALVTNHERFPSSAGLGMADIRKPDSWRTMSPLSEIDPPAHTAVRRALNRILSPALIRAWRGVFEAEAASLADQLVERGDVDGVKDIAEAFVLEAFPRVLGVSIPKQDFLAIGDMNFNQLGPNNARVAASVAAVAPIMGRYEETFQRRSMLPGGFGEQIFEAEDRGELPAGTAHLQVRGFVRGGVDTTIAGIGFALQQLALHPEQWAMIRLNPAMARLAFEEAIRFESPAQVLFRTAATDTELGGCRVGRDIKIGYFIGAANRDPRKWERPDAFDITRNSAGVHVAFGAGVHLCIGQMIARLEAECILTALAKRASTLSLRGTPRLRPVNTLRTLATLPLRIAAA